MALRRSTRDDSTDVEVPRLADDPRHAEAAALLEAFRDHQGRLERERDRLVLRRHFGDRNVQADGPADKQLRARLAKLEAEGPILPGAAAVPPTTDAPPAIVRGIEILNGEPTPPPPDHGARMGEIDRQTIAIREAVFAQNEVVGRIVDELSFEASKHLRPTWDRLQVEMFRAAQELARATDRVLEFRSAIIAAGIAPRSDVLRAPNSRVPLLLGSEREFSSEISQWRRLLEQFGLLG